MSNKQDQELLEIARSSYQAVLAQYRPLDQQIALDVSNWDPTDGFVPVLANICEQLALAMLGADYQFTDEEIKAFNIIFARDDSGDNIRTRSLATSVIREEVLFEQIDQFVLASVQADAMLKQDLTSQALDFFMSLGEVMALIDNHYHREENRLFQALVERIRQDWQSVYRYTSESEPALLLTLQNGSKIAYAFQSKR